MNSEFLFSSELVQSRKIKHNNDLTIYARTKREINEKIKTFSALGWQKKSAITPISLPEFEGFSVILASVPTMEMKRQEKITPKRAERRKRIVFLRQYKQLSIYEIAKEVGVSEITVRHELQILLPNNAKLRANP